MRGAAAALAWVALGAVCWGCSDDDAAPADAAPSDARDAGVDVAEDVSDGGADAAPDSGALPIVVRGRVVDRQGVAWGGVAIRTDPPSEAVLTGRDGTYTLTFETIFAPLIRATADCVHLPCATPQATQDIVVVDGETEYVADFVIDVQCQADEASCDGIDDDCDGELDEGVKNACGGCAALPAPEGSVCGVCGIEGIWQCVGTGALACAGVGDGVREMPLEGDPCRGEGTVCGAWVCDEGEAVCRDPDGGCR